MNDFFLMRKNLFRKKLRAFLLLASIAVAFLIFGLLKAFEGAFYRGNELASATRLFTVNKINFTQPIPISYVNRVSAVKGVKRVTYMTWFGGYYRETKNALIMFATDPGSYLDTYPEAVVSPAERACFLKKRDGLMVGDSTANLYHWKVGQRVPISSNIYSNKAGGHSWNFEICGIYTVSKAGGSAQNLLFNYQYFNDSVTFGQDHLSFMVLTTESASINDAIMRTVDGMFANSAAETKTQTEAAFSRSFTEQFGNIRLIIGLVTGAAFITILMIVGNTMVMAARERTREIGVLKTLGFPEGRILRLVLGESLFLSIFGGAIGLALAFFATGALTKGLQGRLPALHISAQTFAEAFLIMAALGLLTGLLPALSAMRLNIVTALGRR